MNERIKQLANEAGLLVYNPNGVPTKLEKFAELIVRECAGLCLTHEMADEPFGEKSYRKGRHFNVMIKEHFGVE